MKLTESSLTEVSPKRKYRFFIYIERTAMERDTRFANLDFSEENVRMKKGIRLNPKDNVGVVIQDVDAGEEVTFGNGLIVTALDSILPPHKLALADIKAGDYVVKYGEIMGYATRDISAGCHVHDHNCDSEKLMK